MLYVQTNPFIFSLHVAASYATQHAVNYRENTSYTSFVSPYLYSLHTLFSFLPSLNKSV